MRTLVFAVLGSSLLISCGENKSTGAGGSSSSTSTTSSSSASGSTTSSVSSAMSSSSTGAPLPPELSCVGSATFPAPTASTANLETIVADVVSNTPFVGVTVDVCNAADVDCASPISTKVTVDTMTFNTVVPTPMPYGFDGFFRTSGGGTMTTEHYFNPFFRDAVLMPMAGDSRGLYLGTATPGEANMAASIAGVMLDPARGQIILAMTDCTFTPWGSLEPGITFSIDNADMNTKVVYTTNTGIPKPSLTSTQSSGAAVIFNVKPGPAVIHAAYKGEEVAKRTVPAKVGILTHVLLAPRPNGL